MYNYIVKFGLKTNIGVNVLHFSRPALALQPLQLKKKIHKNKIKHRQINKSFTSYYFQVALYHIQNFINFCSYDALKCVWNTFFKLKDKWRNNNFEN